MKRLIVLIIVSLIICLFLLVVVGLVMVGQDALEIEVENKSSILVDCVIKVCDKEVASLVLPPSTVKHVLLKNYKEGGVSVDVNGNTFSDLNYLSAPYVDRPFRIVVTGPPLTVSIINAGDVDAVITRKPRNSEGDPIGDNKTKRTAN